MIVNNMKIIFVTATLFMFSFLAVAQQQSQSDLKGGAYYLNPIFAGNYADPSVIGITITSCIHPLNIAQGC